MELLINKSREQNGAATKVVAIKSELRDLISKFEDKLRASLLPDQLRSGYTSIDDLLIKKYHISGIDKLDFPDFRHKTEFITDGVRGNVQKISGNVLSYQDGDNIIDEAINEDIP